MSPVLNLADDLKVGVSQVDKVYRGAAQIWPAGGPPPVWSPPDLSGVYEGWDASDAGSITESGGAVSSWAGQLSIATLTQSSAPSKPSTGVLTINGLNALGFTSDVTYMTGTISSLTPPVTFYIVYESSTTGGSCRLIDTTGSGMAYDVGDVSSGNRFIYSGSLVSMGAPTTNLEQAVVLFDGASSQVWVNDVSQGTGDPGTTNTGVDLFLGVASDLNIASTGYGGKIGELWIQDAAGDATDRSNWSDYCTKWGL